MWRQNQFMENPDSDQSISEEEFDNGELGRNCLPLGGSTGKKEALQLQSQLEMLRGSHELLNERKDLSEKQTRSAPEDEVEVPDSADEGNVTHSARKVFAWISDDEVISDNEAQHDGACTWSTVTKETEALIYLNGRRGLQSCSSSHSAFSKGDKCTKVVKGKVRSNVFRFQPHKGMPSKAHEMPETLKTIDHRKVEALEHGCNEHSMTELLDGLQENIDLLKGNCEVYNRGRGKRSLIAVKRHVSSLERRTTVNEELPESMDSRSSTDDETNHNLVLSLPEMKRQSIADRFLEALHATSLSDVGTIATAAKPSCSGLFGKLQQVMQYKKERDAEFLRTLNSEASPNNKPGCMDVKILSRYLDAKLTVCQCSVGKNLEGSPWPDGVQTVINGGRQRTIIFNPNVCGDVELEVGNWIRIHAPWEEVEVMGNDERIVLSPYFSRILT